MNERRLNLTAFLLIPLSAVLVSGLAASADAGVAASGGPVAAPASTIVSSAAGFLTLQLSPTFRAAVAVGLAFLLWVVFPLPVGLLCRAHLAGQSSLSPDERLRVYLRWQRRLQWAAAIGAYLTLLLLGLVLLRTGTPISSLPRAGGLARIAGLIGGPLQSLASWWLWYWCGAVMRFTALPLYQEANPALPDLTLRGAVMGLGFVLAAPVVVLPIHDLVATNGKASVAGYVPYIFGGGTALLGLFLVALLTPLLRHSVRHRPPPLPVVPDDREGIPASLRELGERAVEERKGPEPSLAAGVNLDPKATDNALKLMRAVRELDPDQQAALSASAACAMHGWKMQPMHMLLGLLALGLILLVGGIALCFVSGSELPVAWGRLIIVVALVSAITGVLGKRMGRQLERRQDEADLLVAKAMDEPQRLLTALRRLEEIEAASWGADSPFIQNSSYGKRRERLERRLGLD
ncbi:MAG TPA: hypothetical protein VK689_02685 [Armatimonadota bacterium]|nr:hypothetical protein [Armatimonadota bacterium]